MRGGVRIPGPGKKLGAPRKESLTKSKRRSIWLLDSQYLLVQRIKKLNGWGAVKEALDQLKKLQTTLTKTQLNQLRAFMGDLRERVGYDIVYGARVNLPSRKRQILKIDVLIAALTEKLQETE